LKESAKGSGESARVGFTRKTLVIGEVALAVVLLVCASLMIRTFAKLQAVELGFRPENLVTAVVPLPVKRYTTLEQRNRFAAEFLERVKAIPGVEAASIGNGGLPAGGLPSAIELEGAADGQQRQIYMVTGSEEYLNVTRIPLLRGRMFTDREVLSASEIALVNETTVRLWGAEKDLLGRRVKVEALKKPPGATLARESASEYVTIVGVIGDIRNAGLRSATDPVVVTPYTLVAPPGRTIAVRSRGDAGALIAAMKGQLRQIDKEQPLGNPRTGLQNLEMETVQPRFTMVLFGVFAGIGLGLAALGIYSVLSFLVARRTHEIGVRMALGAQWSDILRLILGAGGRVVGLGLVIGLFAAFAATRLLAAHMFGVTPVDPISYSAVVLVLSAVTLLACYVPARRAAGVNPTEALRYE